MVIPIQCPECQSKYRLGDDMAGLSVRCRECSAVLNVPLPVRPKLDRSESDYAGLPRRRAARRQAMEVPPIVPTILLTAFGVLSFCGIAWMVLSRMMKQEEPVVVVETETEVDTDASGSDEQSASDDLASQDELTKLQSGPCVLLRYDSFDGKDDEIPSAASRAMLDLSFVRQGELIIDPFQRVMTFAVRGSQVDAQAMQIELEKAGFVISATKYYPDGVRSESKSEAD